MSYSFSASTEASAPAVLSFTSSTTCIIRSTWRYYPIILFSFTYCIHIFKCVCITFQLDLQFLLSFMLSCNSIAHVLLMACHARYSTPPLYAGVWQWCRSSGEHTDSEPGRWWGGDSSQTVTHRHVQQETNRKNKEEEVGKLFFSTLFHYPCSTNRVAKQHNLIAGKQKQSGMSMLCVSMV